MKDLSTREDIQLLVNTFYEKIKNDELLSPIFSHVDWEKHLPIMYDFWDAVLFGRGTYGRNAFIPHWNVHQKTPLQQYHFGKWLFLFHQTLDELFVGENTEIAKQKSTQIGQTLYIRLNGGIQIEK